MELQETEEFEALYEAMWKCRRGKMWKSSAANFTINGIENVLKLAQELRDDTYQPRIPHKFQLYYPKKRECASSHFRDRVVQRSMNDNIVYPAMTNSFVYDNAACQIGKGTTFAMDRIDKQLHRYYINNGNSNEGWVLQCDLKGYYQHIRHKDAEACFKRHLDDDVADECMRWLNRRYPTDVGFNPGSQMVQIAGIALLDKLDHFIKEQLHIKVYIRNMDDFILVHKDKAYLEQCLERIRRELDKLGMILHPKKTRIYRLKDGIKVLGFTFKLTDTGKIVRILDPDNVKHERKKLYRMAKLVLCGEITMEKFNQCYESWKAHARLGNSYKLLQRMDAYVKSLFTEVHYENRTINRHTLSAYRRRKSGGGG